MISLSLVKMRLSLILTLSSLMIWYSGLTALFLLLLARAAPAYLPTAFSKALRPLFPFRLAQYVQVFPLKPAPFCTLFAGLGSTKPATSLLFSYVTVVLSSSPCPLLRLSFYLKLSGRFDWNCLFSPVLSGYNRSPDTHFFRGRTRLMNWPDAERHLRPLQSFVVSLLLPLVFTLLFSDWRRTVSSKFFRHTNSLDFHRGTCVLSSCSLCSLSCTLQRTQPSVRFSFL